MQWLYLCYEESQTGTTHKVKTKLVLILSQNNAVKIAADEVAKDDAAVDAEDFPEMEFPERKRHAAVVEGVGNAVGEATDDEERNCEEERKEVLLACKTDGSGHHHTAADSEEAAAEGTNAKTELKDSLSCALDIHWADTCKE